MLVSKCEMLCKFFNAMVTSVRLLRCRRLSSTFTNICSQVEAITDRMFTVKHLAQLKYILPEAIILKRIHVQDEETCCMKDELLITLDVDSIKNAKDGLGCPNLRKAFRARVMDFCNSNPEDADVPEGSIPEVKNLKNTDPLVISIDEEFRVAAASHVPQSFKRHFSQKFSIEKVEETAYDIQETAAAAYQNEDLGSEDVLESLQPLVSSLEVLEKPIKVEPAAASASAYPNEDPGSADVLESLQPLVSSLEVPETPIKKETGSSKAKIEGTPAKVALTPGKLMVATPALKPEKGCYMSPVDEAPSESARRSHRSRSLKFDPPEETANDKDIVTDVEGSSVDGDAPNFVPQEAPLQPVREKGLSILEEQDPAISQTKRRQELIAGLPKLFELVHLLFQSIQRSFITKEELLYKVLIGHSDIVDRGEIEEQLKLLMELAPEYLTEKPCLSGDTLLHFNKSSSADSVGSKLLEAR